MLNEKFVHMSILKFNMNSLLAFSMEVNWWKTKICIINSVSPHSYIMPSWYVFQNDILPLFSFPMCIYNIHPETQKNLEWPVGKQTQKSTSDDDQNTCRANLRYHTQH